METAIEVIAEAYGDDRIDRAHDLLSTLVNELGNYAGDTPEGSEAVAAAKLIYRLLGKVLEKQYSFNP